MFFTVDCGEFEKVLNDIRRSVSSATPYVSIQVFSSGIIVSASNNQITHSVTIPCSTGEEGSVTVSMPHLTGIIKNRQELTFRVVGTMLTFDDGNKYNGEMATVSYEEHPLDVDENASKLTFTKEQVDVLTKTVALASIKGRYQGNDQLPMNVFMSERGLEIICFDSFHISCIEDTSMAFSDASLVVYPNVFSRIADACKGESYRLSIGDNYITAKNERFNLRQPLLQPGASQTSVPQVRSVINSFTDTLPSFCVSTKELQSALNNMNALYYDGVPVSLDLLDDTLTMRIQTMDGSVQETIGCTDTKNLEALSEKTQLDMGVLMEFMPKIKVPVIPVKINGYESMLLQYEVGDLHASFCVSLC